MLLSVFLNVDFAKQAEMEHCFAALIPASYFFKHVFY